MPSAPMKRKTTGWKTVALGDVAINSTVATQTPEEDGFTRYIIGKHIPGDGGRITTWGDVGDGEFGSRIRTVIKPGDIVCTTRGPKLRVAVATFDCLSAHTNFVLRTSDAGVMLQEYLQALACSDGFQEHLRRNFRGSTNLFVNWSDAAKFQFALPPLEEQSRIANGLGSVQSQAEALRELRSTAEMLRMAAMNEFFVSRIASAQPLSRVAGIHAGGTPSRARQSYWGGSLPWASGKDLKVRDLVTTEERLSEEGWSVAKIAPEGATLVVVRGMILAHTFPVARCVVPMAFNQDLRAIVPGDDLLPEYLTLWAEWAGGWFLSRTGESSHGTKRIEGSVIDSAPIPVPATAAQAELITKQERILGAIGAINERMLRARSIRQRMCDSLLQEKR